MCQLTGVGDITIMEKKPRARNVRVRINVIDSVGIKCAGAADQTVHFIAFGEKELGEITPILAGNTCDQSTF